MCLYLKCAINTPNNPITNENDNNDYIKGLSSLGTSFFNNRTLAINTEISICDLYNKCFPFVINPFLM